jgi:hypothetical protein
MVVPVGYAQATYIFGGTALPNGAVCTMGLDIGGYPDDPSDAAQDCYQLWATHILPNQNILTQLQGVEVKFGPDDLGPSGSYTQATSGGSAGNSSPPNVSYLVRKQTAGGGRPNRGRMFVPGVSESDVGSEGLILPAAVTAMNADLVAWGAAMATNLLAPVILHGVASPVTTPTPITALTVDARAATQRLRLRR